jgi:hypothetical protein
LGKYNLGGTMSHTSDEEILESIFSRRGGGRGGNSHRTVELFDGKMVPTLNNEPDPDTFREDWYYNTRRNKLYKRIPQAGFLVWKNVVNI